MRPELSLWRKLRIVLTFVILAFMFWTIVSYLGFRTHGDMTTQVAERKAQQESQANLLQQSESSRVLKWEVENVESNPGEWEGHHPLESGVEDRLNNFMEVKVATTQVHLGFPEGPYCSSSETPKDEAGLDKQFYTSYQKGVLHTRQPFSIDKGFFRPAVELYKDKELWLDAGAGTCGTMRALKTEGIDVYGVELSDVCNTECRQFAKQGLVFSTGLNKIPFPSRTFDLVWSTEVFEHVPTLLLNESVAEVVRVAKKDLFLTIAMKRSGFDPSPPARPRIHISVMPRTWWDAIFGIHGCRVNLEVRDSFNLGGYAKAAFFPYICHEGSRVVPDECEAPVAEYAKCYAQYFGDASKCRKEKSGYEVACNFKVEMK